MREREMLGYISLLDVALDSFFIHALRCVCVFFFTRDLRYKEKRVRGRVVRV